MRWAVRLWNRDPNAAIVVFALFVAAMVGVSALVVKLVPDTRTVSGATIRDYSLEMVAANVDYGGGNVWNAWTFNGTVPGPALKVRVGEVLRVKVTNKLDLTHSFHTHLTNYTFENDGSQANIIAGKGQGAMIAPGGAYTYEFQPTTPGIYYYYCHSADGGLHIAHHIHQGLYGAIIVEAPDQPPMRQEVIFMGEIGSHTTGKVPPFIMNGIGLPGGEAVLEAVFKQQGFAGVAAQLNKTVPAFNMKVNEPIKLHVINIGDVEHTFHVHSATHVSLGVLGGRPWPANVLPLDAGAANTLLVNFSTPGLWLFHCNGSVTLTHQYLDDNPTGTPSDTYNVAITVTDDDGGIGSATAPVVVNNVNPVATASAAPNPQYWGLNVNFTGTVTDVGTLDTHTFAWDFGDATSGSGASTAHAYANPGPYTAKLTVTDDDTGKDEKTLAITIKKRETTLVYNGETTAVFGFGSILSAKLSDAVVAAAPIGGRTITFTVNAVNYTGTTAISGQTNNVTLNPFPPLMPGTYTITVNFAGDSHYLPSSTTATLTVTNTVGCKVTAGTLRSANNGRGGFNVQADGPTAIKGELQFQNDSLNFHAPTMTALGCSADRTKAWFAGVGRDGKNFVAYVEDNGEPGRDDIFKIWVNGVPQNGNGALSGGNVQIHKK
ncbi:MAG: PKD domain-containing protein [Chloroflexi bacterium]|nr:PKD domain-containing protein [Chloroflexota bacterium]